MGAITCEGDRPEPKSSEPSPSPTATRGNPGAHHKMHSEPASHGGQHAVYYDDAKSTMNHMAILQHHLRGVAWDRVVGIADGMDIDLGRRSTVSCIRVPPPLVPFALDLDGNLTGPGLVRKVALELPGRQPRGISYRRDTWGAVWNNSAMSRCIGFLKFIARLGDWERR